MTARAARFLAPIPALLPALLALAALCLPVSAQPAPSTGPGFGRFAGVRVDVRPLIERGAGPQALALRDDLLVALRASLADRLAGGRGPDLVVVVRSLSLNPYAGGQGGRGGLGGGTQNDYLDGEALLVERGAVLARHPQLSALPSSSGGAWYDPASERRRITAIAEHYAGWLSRTLPGN